MAKLSDNDQITYKHEIKDVHGNATGSFMELVSGQSDQALNFVFKQTKKLRQYKSEIDVPIEDAFMMQVERLATHIVGWDEDYFDMPYSHENAITVLRKHKFLRVQVQEAIAEDERFFRPNPNPPEAVGATDNDAGQAA